jgi:hypothetical protein
LSGVTVAVGLGAAVAGSAFWPASTGTPDGRLEVIVAVAAMALVVLKAERPRRQHRTPLSIAFLVAYAALAGLVGVSLFVVRPELTLAAIVIGAAQVDSVLRAVIGRPATSTPRSQPSSLTGALQSAASQSLLATAIVIALLADWAVRRPS